MIRQIAGSPYGATTVAGGGPASAERDQLEGASQGKLIAETANKLAGN